MNIGVLLLAKSKIIPVPLKSAVHVSVHDKILQVFKNRPNVVYTIRPSRFYSIVMCMDIPLLKNVELIVFS